MAHRLTTRGTNKKKCKIRSKRVSKVLRDLLLKFWDPLHILGTVGDRNFKYGRQESNANLGQGVVIGSRDLRDLLLKF